MLKNAFNAFLLTKATTFHKLTRMMFARFSGLISCKLVVVDLVSG
jgi:hypothetical protein